MSVTTLPLAPEPPATTPAPDPAPLENAALRAQNAALQETRGGEAGPDREGSLGEEAMLPMLRIACWTQPRSKLRLELWILLCGRADPDPCVDPRGMIGGALRCGIKTTHLIR
jgi:hypothetical protein